MSMKPLSSRNAMWAPSLRAFFCRGPLVPLPMGDGLLVALDCAAFRYLAAPAAGLQHAPEVARMILNAELLADQRRDPLQSPQLVGETIRHGASEQEPQQSIPLPRGQLLRTSRDGFRCQRRVAVLLPPLSPAMDRRDRGANPSRDLAQSQSLFQQLDGAP